MHKVSRDLGEMSYCFSRSWVWFQVHTVKRAFFNLIYGFFNVICQISMSHAWRGIEHMSFSFPMSSSQIQGHTGQKKMANLASIWAFEESRSVSAVKSFRFAVLICNSLKRTSRFWNEDLPQTKPHKITSWVVFSKNNRWASLEGPISWPMKNYWM